MIFKDNEDMRNWLFNILPPKEMAETLDLSKKNVCNQINYFTLHHVRMAIVTTQLFDDLVGEVNSHRTFRGVLEDRIKELEEEVNTMSKVAQSTQEELERTKFDNENALAELV